MPEAGERVETLHERRSPQQADRDREVTAQRVAAAEPAAGGDRAEQEEPASDRVGQGGDDAGHLPASLDRRRGESA